MKSTTTTLFLLAFLILNITICSRSFLRKSHILKPDLLLIQKSTQKNEADDGRQYFVSNIYPEMTTLYNVLINETVAKEVNTIFANLTYSSDDEKKNLFCNKNFLPNLKTKVMTAYNKALNETKLHNFTDEFSPLLLSLREKYENKKTAIINLNKNYTDDSTNFQNLKNSYATQAQQLIAVFDDAISRLSYIAKYKLLELKGDLETEFTKFKAESLPQFSQNATQDLLKTFSSIWSYCVPDFLNMDCNIDKNSEQEKEMLKESILTSIKEMEAKDVSDAKSLDEQGFIVLLKKTKKSLEYTRDMVKEKEYISLFVDLAQEFERDAEEMNQYLSNLKPFQPSDIVQPVAKEEEKKEGDNNSKVPLQNEMSPVIEPQFSVYTFKDHFLNLLDSTAFICWVVKHDAFGDDISQVKNVTYISAQNGTDNGVSDQDVENIFKLFTDNKDFIRARFLIPVEEKSVDEFITSIGLYCPYSFQTEEMMKSQCYANIIQKYGESRWDKDLKEEQVNVTPSKAEEEKKEEIKKDTNEKDGLFYINNNGDAKTPDQKSDKFLDNQNSDKKEQNGSETPSNNTKEPEKPVKPAEEKDKKEELIPVAPLKSEDNIVQVNPENNNNVQPSNTPTTTSSSTNSPTEGKTEANTDLKVLPDVIPDDQKDSPKNSDSSKGSNETI